MCLVSSIIGCRFQELIGCLSLTFGGAPGSNVDDSLNVSYLGPFKVPFDRRIVKSLAALFLQSVGPIAWHPISRHTGRMMEKIILSKVQSLFPITAFMMSLFVILRHITSQTPTFKFIRNQNLIDILVVNIFGNNENKLELITKWVELIEFIVVLWAKIKLTDNYFHFIFKFRLYKNTNIANYGFMR